jgi:Cu2+-exporting ATPase
MIGRYVRHYSATGAVVDALTYAIAILVVSCPCAIGLAVRFVLFPFCLILTLHVGHFL